MVSMVHRARWMAAAGALVAFVGCGGGAAHAARRELATHLTPSSATPAPTPAAGAPADSCAQLVTATLGRITKNIYGQALSGRGVQAATRRLARSSQLAVAVAHRDPYETAAALAPLIKHQIVRIVITGGGRRLAVHGQADAVAPVHRAIVYRGRIVGYYTLSVSGARALVSEMQTLTGARILVRGGAPGMSAQLHGAPRGLARAGIVRVGGRSYRATSFAGRRFPSGPMRFWALVPPADAATCGATRDETVTQTIGAVGRRLLTGEATGSAVHRVLHVVGTDRGFARAVAARDPAAMQRAVLRLFKDRNLHVVRIAATLPDGTQLNDVGGPYALAAASGPVTTRDGRRVGTVTLSVQDDTGYIKLMHRFTGAAVQLRLPHQQVPGSTLAPGPATIPDTGPVTYRGRAYHASSFATTAFDGTPLRISLLVPDGLPV